MNSWKLGEDAHLTLPSQIFPVQVNSRSMLHHGSVGVNLKQNKRNLTLTLTLTFYYLLIFFIIKFVFLS